MVLIIHLNLLLVVALLTTEVLRVALIAAARLTVVPETVLVLPSRLDLRVLLPVVVVSLREVQSVVEAFPEVAQCVHQEVAVRVVVVGK